MTEFKAGDRIRADVMKAMDEKDWQRIFDRHRAVREAAAEAELAVMMARQKSEYLVSDPGVEGNRAERRKRAARARKVRP